MRLIDADKLVETIVNTPSEVAKIHTYNVLSSLAERQNEILDIVENSPTIEANPVLHGRWGEYEMFRGWPCTACGKYMTGTEPKYPYCPNCGAKMDGGVSDG